VTTISNIALRWLKQAEADLNAAKNSLSSKNYDWSCFQAQQSAEKGLKAYLYNLGYTSIITHSLKELVLEAKKKEPSFSNIESEARHLDLFYIATRYPNGLAGNLSPSEFYEKSDAEKCINYAESILKIVKNYI